MDQATPSVRLIQLEVWDSVEVTQVLRKQRETVFQCGGGYQEVSVAYQLALGAQVAADA